jgi:hypothetical protein
MDRLARMGEVIYIYIYIQREREREKATLWEQG